MPEWRTWQVAALTIAGAGCVVCVVTRWRKQRDIYAREKNTHLDEPISGYPWPIIDLSELRGRNGKDRRDAALETLAAACETHGIFRLVGHGVPEELTASCHEVAGQFFAMALSEKLRCCNLARTPTRGYVPRGDTLSTMEREIYLVNRVDRPATQPEAYYTDPAAASFLASDIADENVWPHTIGYEAAEADQFRSNLTAYYKHMERISKELLASMAVVLGLPEEYFQDKFDKHISNMEASFSSLEWLEPGEPLVNAHVDAEVFTVLSHKQPSTEDNVLGLEVQSSDGKWLALAYMEGALLVNIGNTLSLWTGSRWKAPVHRVVNSKDQKVDKGDEVADTGHDKPPIDLSEWFQLQHTDADRRSSRQCIAFFMHPNYDVPIYALPERKNATKHIGNVTPGVPSEDVKGDAYSPLPITAGELAQRSARRFTLVGTENSENLRAGRLRATR